MKILQNRSGLYFAINGEKYESLDHLINKLNKEISNAKLTNIKVEWYWDFYGDDVIDTINGKYLDTYYFELALIPYK